MSLLNLPSGNGQEMTVHACVKTMAEDLVLEKTPGTVLSGAIWTSMHGLRSWLRPFSLGWFCQVGGAHTCMTQWLHLLQALALVPWHYVQLLCTTPHVYKKNGLPSY